MVRHHVARMPRLLLGCLWLAAAGQAAGVEIRRVSVGPDGQAPTSDVRTATLAGDGRLAAFAGNTFSGLETNAWYLRRLDAATTERHALTTPENDVQRVILSADGRLAAYQVQPGGYPMTQVVEVATGSIIAEVGEALRAFSPDGRWLVTTEIPVGTPTVGDARDLVIRAVPGGLTHSVGLSEFGDEDSDGWIDHYHATDAAISDGGRWVAFTRVPIPGQAMHSDAGGVWLLDREAGSALRISATFEDLAGGDSGEDDARSQRLSITPDGRYVAYTAVEAGMTTVRVYDRIAGFSHRVSNAAGAVPGGHSHFPSISADGRYVAFSSLAADIVSGDTNGAEDVFRFDRVEQRVLRVSVGASGQQANGRSLRPSIAADGASLTFLSAATNLAAGDTNGVVDAYWARIPDDEDSTPSPTPDPEPPAGGTTAGTGTAGATSATGGGTGGSSGGGGDGGGGCGVGGSLAALALASLVAIRRRARP